MRKLPGLDRGSRRLRYIFVGLALVLLAFLGAWFLIQKFYGMDRYRAMVVQRIESVTGMPCTIDAMSLNFIPHQQILLSGLHIGEGDTTITVAKVAADVSARALLRGQIDVPSVLVEGLEADLPETFTGATHPAEKTTPANDTDNAARQSSGARLGAVSIPEWTVKRGGTLYAKGSGRAEDLLGANAKFSADATLPGLSPEAKAAVTGTITRADGKFSLDGNVALQNTDLAKAVHRDDVASAVLNANLAFSGSAPDDIAFTLAGTIAAAAGHADLEGKVSGKAWWKQGEFTANDFTWDSSGLHLLADLSRKANGELAVHIRDSKAEGDGLKLLLGAASSKTAALDARKDATISLKDVLVGREADGSVRWVKGDINVSGIDAMNGKQSLLEDVRAKCHLEEGTLHVLDATASGMRLAGDLSPAGKQAVSFNLAATAELSNPLISDMLPPSIQEGAKGKIEIKRLSGTWRPDGGLPTDLALEGTLADGELNINTDRFNDALRGLVMSFATDGKTIRAKAQANSTHMGSIKFYGTCDATTRATDGSVSFSMNKLAAAFVPSGQGADIAKAMLAAYDGASFDVSFRMPASAKEPGRFTFEHKDDPKLSAQAALLLDDKHGVTTGDISADMHVPFAPAAKAFPIPASGSGDAVLHFERNAGARFTGHADLSNVSLRVDPYLFKREGAPLTLDIDGSAGDNWALEHLTLNVLGESIALTPKDGGLAAEKLQLNLAKLTPLFPDGSEATGTVTGSAAITPPRANLRLATVRVKTPSGIAIDELNGGLEYSPDALGFDHLHIAAYNSDFTLDGAMKGGRFAGEMKGKRADIDLLAGIGASTKSGAAKNSEQPAAAKKKGLNGELDIALDEVLFRRATFESVKAHALFNPEEFNVEKISCAPYGGNARGELRVQTPGGGAEGRTSIAFDFENVDLKLLDDLSPAEPRGMYGPATGKVDLDFPTGPNAKPYMDMNGQITASARDGSLGKAGASGKILAALRATELAQLQIPSFRDKGLSFANADADITFKHGVFTINRFELSERTHAMSATGELDFPQDDMDVTIKIQLLEGVRDIIGALPLMDKLSQSGGIYVYITGSPFDPKASAARVRPLKELRETPGNLLHGVRKLFRR